MARERRRTRLSPDNGLALVVVDLALAGGRAHEDDTSDGHASHLVLGVLAIKVEVVDLRVVAQVLDLGELDSAPLLTGTGGSALCT